MLNTALYLYKRFSGHIHAHQLQLPDKRGLAYFPLFSNKAYVVPDVYGVILLYFLLSHWCTLFRRTKISPFS